jgi:hypothetical protein
MTGPIKGSVEKVKRACEEESLGGDCELKVIINIYKV